MYETADPDDDDIRYITWYTEEGIFCRKAGQAEGYEWAITFENTEQYDKVMEFIGQFPSDWNMRFAAHENFWNDFLNDEIDICIGFNEDATKPHDDVLNLVTEHFAIAGLKVGINTPYSNSMREGSEQVLTSWISFLSLTYIFIYSLLYSSHISFTDILFPLSCVPTATYRDCATCPKSQGIISGSCDAVEYLYATVPVFRFVF